MTRVAHRLYARTIDRAALTLLAMSLQPSLKSLLVSEIAAAVAVRGGRIDNQFFARFDLRAVFDEIAERTMALLSAVLRARLPGIADEMDEAFGDNVRRLLASLADWFPTI